MNQELVLAVREQSRHRCCPFFHEGQSQEEYRPIKQAFAIQHGVCCDREGRGAMEHIGGHLTQSRRIREGLPAEA